MSINLSDLKEVKEALRYHRLQEIRDDICAFAEYVMVDPSGKPWKLGTHHREWYGLLMSVVKELIAGEEIPPNKITNLFIMAPREHGKTSTIVCFLLYMLGVCPRLRIKYVCCGDELATDIVGQVKKNIEKNERLHEIFPNLMKDQDATWTKHELNVVRTDSEGGFDVADLGMKDASLKAFGITGMATGGRADLIIFDDIIGSRAAIQEPGRLDTIERLFYTDWLNIGGKVHVVVGTPWTPDDVHAQLINSEHWLKWRKPAIINNQPLWPEVWPIERLIARRAQIGEVAFDLQFMLTGVTHRSSWWSASNIERCKNYNLALGDTLTPNKGIVIGLDPAASLKKTAAFSCITVAGYDENKRRTILAIERSRKDPEQIAERIIQLSLEYHPNIVLVENNATQQAFLSLIKVISDYKYGGISVPVKDFFTGSNKWNPEVGLPRLVTTMENGMWIFPFDGDHDTPLHECGICQLCKELLGYPLETKSTDMIMSLWLADTAIEVGSVFGNLPSIVRTRKEEIGW